jgi:hypothetical protein
VGVLGKMLLDGVGDVLELVGCQHSGLQQAKRMLSGSDRLVRARKGDARVTWVKMVH